MPVHPRPNDWTTRMRQHAALLFGWLFLTACAVDLQVHTSTPSAASATVAATASATVAATTPTTARYTHRGTLMRGERFAAQVAPNLTVQLVPIAHGWEIWVGDLAFSSDATRDATDDAADEAADNFAMPVTPPFYGINARLVEGWHFRNIDNSGPNAVGDKNVNAPGKVRDFCFVDNGSDFQTALAALSNGLPALAEAVAKNTFPIHRGTLTITDYTLGNLVANEQAWFESIDFTVTLGLDQPCPLS